VPSAPRPSKRPYPSAPAASAAPEVVDPSWILKAAGAVVVLGLVCSYLTLCAAFYAGQWQFVLHPSRTVAQTPAAIGLAFTPVRFGPGPSGEPELTGWWLPSDTASDPIALVLHSETGSMSDALPAAKALHDARLNVFVFDYRGFGQSAGRHPTESQMQHDAASALAYLQDAHHAQPSSLVTYGTGLGASLAVKLCAEHPDLAGLILENADGDTLSRVEADSRSRIVPMSLLFHERFPLADPLSTLHTPKLLLSHTSGSAPLIAQRAATPKMTVELGPTPDAAKTTAAIRRFLDTYVSHPAPILHPTSPTP
jgi:uncharacterized protein